MNNEEPISAPVDNVNVGGFGSTLPEQPKFATQAIPRPMDISCWINQWQPMGIRVVVDLPFVSDDSSYLFVIRNGPLIPHPMRLYHDYNNAQSTPPNHAAIGPRHANLTSDNINVYAWNNMRNVLHSSSPNWSASDVAFGDNYPIRVVYHDLPPPLSSLAHCFRRWRGDMQYRIRTVAGFATQGYVFAACVKNIASPIMLMDPFKYKPPLMRQDHSYREAMQNAYVMADTSMFRHIEVTSLFEYPVDWYDQFMWMARRVSPTTVLGDGQDPQWHPREPHADNFIVVGVRGELVAGHTGAQIAFELEYRGAEGFQFSDPYLPDSRMFSTKASPDQNQPPFPIIVPSNTKSNGIRIGEEGWPPGTAPDGTKSNIRKFLYSHLTEAEQRRMEDPRVSAREKEELKHQAHKRRHHRETEFS